MKAFVLCGGKGEKIWPYNEKNQKACLPIGGVPNILRIVRQLQDFNVDDIVIVTGHMEEQVKFILRKEKKLSFVSSASKGIGEVIFNLAGHDSDILIYYGDIYLEDVDLEQVLNKYSKSGSTVLLEHYKNQFKTIDHICAQADDIVHAFYGHPREHYVNARCGGLFIISSEIAHYLNYSPNRFLNLCVGGMSKEEFYLEQCLQTAIEDGHVLNAAYASKGIIDLDYPWDIMSANEAYCHNIIGNLKDNLISSSAMINDTAIIKGNIILGENSIIGEHVIFEGNCMIGNNTIIKNGAIIGENSVIGNNCVISDYCKISSDTVIGNYNKIGYLAEITGVTFDKVAAVHNCEIFGVVGTNVDIAANCQVAIMKFNDSDTVQRVGEKNYQVKFSNGVFLGDYTRTGVSNTFLPGIKVGVNSALGPGCVIDHDIPSNQLILVKQETIVKDWGPEKYGW